MSLFNELKRRNVFRVGLAYLVSAWVIAQVASLVLDSIEAPAWVMQAILLLMGLGFIIALIIAWAYELTPEGIKKEKDVIRDESITSFTAKKLDYITIAGVLLVGALFVYQQINPTVIVREAITDSTPEHFTGVKTLPKAINDENSISVSDKSIAVLPFVNMSSDKEQEYFSDGLTESLLHQLAQIKELRVAARTSSFKFKGHNEDMINIGQQLRVAHLLEGSVQRAGDVLRITAQLIKADDGFHLWSQSYDRKTQDLFAIQDEISQEVVKALKVSLLGAIDHKSIGGTENSLAYEEYVKGLLAYNQGSYESLPKAVDYFKTALMHDPNYQLAIEGLGQTYTAMQGTGLINWKDLGAMIDPISKQLLTINKNSGVGYGLKGISEWAKDSASAQTTFEKAYALAPNNSYIVDWLADFYNEQGQTNKAIDVSKKHLQLDPLSSEVHTSLANLYFALDQNKKALFHAQQIQSLKPNDPNSFSALQRIYRKSLNIAKANELLSNAEALDPNDHEIPANMAINYLAVLMPAQGQKQLKRAEEINAQGQATIAIKTALLYQQGELKQAAGLALQVIEDNPGPRYNFSRSVFVSVLLQYAYETEQPELIVEKLLPWLNYDIGQTTINNKNQYTFYLSIIDTFQTLFNEKHIQQILSNAENYRATTDSIDKYGVQLNNAKRNKQALLAGLEKSQAAGIGIFWWLEFKSHRFDWIRKEPRFKAVEAKILATVKEQQGIINNQP